MFDGFGIWHYTPFCGLGGRAVPVAYPPSCVTGRKQGNRVGKSAGNGGRGACMSYIPNLTEFVVLALGSIGACAVGALLFWVWSIRSRTRPFGLTLLALFLGCAVFGFAQYTLYQAADARWHEEVVARSNAAAAANMLDPGEESRTAEMAAIEQGAQKGVEARHLHIFLYGALFAFLPLWYYARALASSLADQPVESAFAMSAMPGQHGPFRAAQALARRGDIDGAVDQYKRYTYNTSEAWLAAARLLQNDGRYEESAAMYIDIMQNYGDTVRTWSEAAFELAKLKEMAFGERQDALRLLNQIIERDPEGQYGHMAIRLQRRILSGQQDLAPGTEELIAKLDAQFEEGTLPTIEPPMNEPDPGAAEEQPSTS